MAKLITDAEFAEIREVINDVSETFLQKTITYQLKVQSLSRMNRDRNDIGSYTDVSLSVLVVWEQSEVAIDRTTGSMDLSDGYALVNWDDLEATILMTTGTLNTDIGADKLIVDGGVMEIIGIEKLGQLKDTFAVLKVYFKKTLKNI